MTIINKIPENSTGGGGYEIKLTRQVSTEQLCNHNELINADFRQGRLVNQRGITFASTGDYSMQSVDLWGVGWYTDLTLHEDGLVIASNTNHSPGMILQKFEHPEDYINKMVTISAIIDGYIVSASGICNPSTYYPATEYNGARIDITENGYRILTFNTNKVSAVMLEYGDISTLHNWHGDYAETLQKCQRYYERIGLGINAKIGGTNGKTCITITHKFAVEKRITPTIKLIKQPQFYNSNVGPILPNNTVIDSLAVDAKAIHYVDLAGFINPLDPSMPYPCHCDTQDFLEISAEL